MPGKDLEQNLADVRRHLEAAVGDGAQLAALPEFGTFLDRSSAMMRSAASYQEDSQSLSMLRRSARDLHIWLLVGSLVILADENSGKLSNRSFLIAPSGEIAAW